MIRISVKSFRRAETALLAFLALLLFVKDAEAQSAGCNRAQAIVEEVRTLYQSPSPDHKAILLKLRTAHQLCPTYGEAWKYAHCSALAAGDDAAARLYRDRAVFNNVTVIDCEAAGVPGSGPPKPPPLPTYVRQKHALVIGIGTFADKSIPKLKYAAKDARDFARVLAEPQSGNFPPANITLLTDEKATRGAILNALQQLFLQTQEDDLVVIYVSSHGSPAQQERGLGGIGYIVTYDTALQNIWVDAIEYQDFAEKTSLIRARRKVAFLDTCFSGQARPGAKALTVEPAGVDEQTARRFLSGEGTFVITSSKSTERSWESDQIHNSYFTYYLIEALKRSKDEPPTVKAVFDYLSSKVADAVAREKQQPQHPQIHPVDGPGDVRIGVVPQAAGSAGGAG